MIHLNVVLSLYVILVLVYMFNNNELHCTNKLLFLIVLVRFVWFSEVQVKGKESTLIVLH